MDGKDVRFMGLAEAGPILLTNHSKNISLGFVSAVQRGYNVCVSRSSLEASTLCTITSLPAVDITQVQPDEKAALIRCTTDSLPQDKCPRSESILARLDAEITHLKMGRSTDCIITTRSSIASSMNTSPTSRSSMNTSPTSRSSTRSSDGGSSTSNRFQGAAEQQHMVEMAAADIDRNEPAPESASVKQLHEQNQELTKSMQLLQKSVNAAESRAVMAEARASNAETAAKEAERRAKAAEARLAVIKAELTRLKEQGRLEESAAKIHESMLTPTHAASTIQNSVQLSACIPEKPLLQNLDGEAFPSDRNGAWPSPSHLAPKTFIPGAAHASSSGRVHNQLARSCNFMYMNGLSAYPPSNTAQHENDCCDPLANFNKSLSEDSKAPPTHLQLDHETISLHTLIANQVLCHGDMLVSVYAPFHPLRGKIHMCAYTSAQAHSHTLMHTSVIKSAYHGLEVQIW